jgi:hypothetical protein
MGSPPPNVNANVARDERHGPGHCYGFQQYICPSFFLKWFSILKISKVIADAQATEKCTVIFKGCVFLGKPPQKQTMNHLLEVINIIILMFIKKRMYPCNIKTS